MRIRLCPSGVEFFDRSTGLNILFDEVSVPRSAWAMAPRHVSIALTNACDLSCPYCYAPKTRASLDFERVCSWLKELDANGCLSVGFGGGEPSLYRNFARLCHYAADNTGLAITFTTHAHRLNDSLLADLSGSVHFVRVSMDGLGSTYESLRGRPFQTLCTILGSLRALAPFGINYVVNALTLPDLDAALMLAADLGASEFLLLPEEPNGTTGGIDKATSLALLHWASSYHGSVRLSISEPRAEGFPICDVYPSESALAKYVHIDASGTLKRTSYDRQGARIGDSGVLKALRILIAEAKGRVSA